MNLFRQRIRRAYAILFAAAIVIICMSMSLCGNDRISDSAIERSSAFKYGMWERNRGEIFDRDGSPIVYNTTANDGKVIRSYENCSEAYSAIIGYRTYLITEYYEDANGVIRHKYGDRLEGLENTMSNWLLTGTDNTNTVGGSLVLTTDSELQEFCYEKIRGFDLAAAVVLDIETGEILAMTDAPAYDTQAVVDAVDLDAYNKLLPANSLNRYCTLPQVPGSVFKIASASVFCDAGAGDTVINDTGRFEYDGYTIKNAGSYTGEMGLASAIRHSSNVYFASVAKQVGAEDMERYYTDKWKFNEKIDLDFTTLSPKLCLDNRQLLYDTAYGQGDTQISPLNICMITAAVGDKNGHFCKPYLFKSFIDAEGNTVKRMNGKREIITRKAVSKQAKKMITEGMIACAKDKGLDNINGKSAAIKTGTATVNNGKVNMWITGFVPAEDPKYAVTVAAFEVPEKGSWGGNLAPVIGEIFNKLTEE